MTFLIVILIILLIYLIVRNPKKKPKSTAFDEFLIQRHLQSEKRAEKIPTITYDEKEGLKTDEQSMDLEEDTEDIIRDLYYSMIKSRKYDTDELKREAMYQLNLSKDELEKELKEFKIDK